MHGKQLVKRLAMDPEELDRLTGEAMGVAQIADLESAMTSTVKDLTPNQIVKGKVLSVLHDGTVVVDVRYKAEGRIPIDEFDDPEAVTPGMEIETLVEDIEDSEGFIALSKRKADRIRGWETIIETHKEGDVVHGTVQRKIKGGLLVDIGVPVFLPASQVNIRRTGDIGEWIGKEIDARIIKIDEERMNIVISRRKLIEEDREKLKKAPCSPRSRKARSARVWSRTSPTSVCSSTSAASTVCCTSPTCPGVASTTRPRWSSHRRRGRGQGPQDRPRARAHRSRHEAEDRFAVGQHRRQVPGRRSHQRRRWSTSCRTAPSSSSRTASRASSTSPRCRGPSASTTRTKSSTIGDQVEVVVLEVNTEKQEISLGMKQTEVNPWDMVSENYPPGTVIRGRVRNLTNYGAFIELQEGIDGLLHITDMSWTKKITHPSEVVKKGDEIECVVLSVDQEKKRIALGLKQLQPDPWASDIPARYHIGDSVPGTVTKITNFGVFVELERASKACCTSRSSPTTRSRTPRTWSRSARSVEVRVIKIDTDERKIGLTLIQAHFDGDEEVPSEPREPAAPAQPALGTLATQLKDLGARIGEREASDDTAAATTDDTGEATTDDAGEAASDDSAEPKGEDA